MAFFLGGAGQDPWKPRKTLRNWGRTEYRIIRNWTPREQREARQNEAVGGGGEDVSEHAGLPGPESEDTDPLESNLLSVKRWQKKPQEQNGSNQRNDKNGSSQKRDRNGNTSAGGDPGSAESVRNSETGAGLGVGDTGGGEAGTGRQMKPSHSAVDSTTLEDGHSVRRSSHLISEDSRTASEPGESGLRGRGQGEVESPSLGVGTRRDDEEDMDVSETNRAVGSTGKKKSPSGGEKRKTKTGRGRKKKNEDSGSPRCVKLWQPRHVSRTRKDLNELDVSLTVYDEALREALETAGSEVMERTLATHWKHTQKHMMAVIRDVHTVTALEKRLRKERAKHRKLQQNMVTSLGTFRRMYGEYQTSMLQAKEARKVAKLSATMDDIARLTEDIKPLTEKYRLDG